MKKDNIFNNKDISISKYIYTSAIIMMLSISFATTGVFGNIKGRYK